MGGDGARLPLAVAQQAAWEVETLLLPGVEYIDTVGSIRRKAKEVGDVEILAVPKMGTEPIGDLLGTTRPVNLLERKVAELLAGGVHGLAPHPTDKKNGVRYKKLWLGDPGIQVDLFIVDGPRCKLCSLFFGKDVEPSPSCKHEWAGSWWGPAYCVRTGPAEFSQSLVTALRGRGMHCEDLAVKKLGTGEVVPCFTEREFFRLCGRPWLPPEMRAA